MIVTRRTRRTALRLEVRRAVAGRGFQHRIGQRDSRKDDQLLEQQQDREHRATSKL